MDPSGSSLGVGKSTIDAQHLDLAEHPRPLREPEQIVGGLEVRPLRSPTERLEPQDLARRHPHDGLEKGPDRLIAQNVANFVEARLVEGLSPAVEILSSVQNTVVNGAFDPQGGSHFDNPLTYPDCDQLVLAVFICDLDPLDQGVV